MPLTLCTAARLLSDHGLLREVIHDDRWMMQVPDDPAADVPFSAITYDTRTVWTAVRCSSARVGSGRSIWTVWTGGGWPPTWPTPIIRPPPAPRD